MMQTKIFVSYSHSDLALVSPVVKLLRANKSLVFMDWDTIEPGEYWRYSIEKFLQEAELVAVFWCAHSNESPEVRKEYLYAAGLGKRVMPILLDDTPLPAELSERQWIDFRELTGTTHSDPRFRLSPPPPGYVGGEGEGGFFCPPEEEDRIRDLQAEMASLLGNCLTSHR